MDHLELWQVLTIIISMSFILLACSGVLLYVIFKPAQEFKDDIEFKPMEKVKVQHVRYNRTD